MDSCERLARLEPALEVLTDIAHELVNRLKTEGLIDALQALALQRHKSLTKLKVRFPFIDQTLEPQQHAAMVQSASRRIVVASGRVEHGI